MQILAVVQRSFTASSAQKNCDKGGGKKKKGERQLSKLLRDGREETEDSSNAFSWAVPSYI